MGKQIIAAVACVFLALLFPAIAFAGSAIADAVSSGQMVAYDSAALVIPVVFGGVAGVLAFASLIWLKLLYGAVAALALGASGLAVTAALDGFVGAGLAGAISMLVIAVLLGFGVRALINWVDEKPESLNMAEEF